MLEFSIETDNILKKSLRHHGLIIVKIFNFLVIFCSIGFKVKLSNQLKYCSAQKIHLFINFYLMFYKKVKISCVHIP